MGWWPILDIRPPYPLQGLPQIVNGIAIAIEHLLIGGIPYDAVNRCEESNEEQTAHLQTALLHSRCECGPRYEPLGEAPFIVRGIHTYRCHRG